MTATLYPEAVAASSDSTRVYPSKNWVKNLFHRGVDMASDTWNAIKRSVSNFLHRHPLLTAWLGLLVSTIGFAIAFVIAYVIALLLLILLLAPFV